MKQVVFLYLFALSVADKLDRTYLPPTNAGTAGGDRLLSAPYQRHDGSLNRFQQPNSVYSNNGFNGGHSSSGFTSPNKNKFSSDFGGTNLQNYGNLNNANAGNRPLSSYSRQPQYAASQNSYGGNRFSSAGSQISPSKYSGGNGFVDSNKSGFAPSSEQSYPPSNILRYNNQNSGDGRYQFDFETENKISQSETGHIQNTGTDREANVVQGDYSYVAPDGRTIAVQYVADENGFRASGDHIPYTPSSQSGGYPQTGTYNPQSNGQSVYQTGGYNRFGQADSNKGNTSPGLNTFPSTYQNGQLGSQSKPFANRVGFGNGQNAYTQFTNQDSIGYNGNLNRATPGYGQSSQAFNHHPGFSQSGSYVGSQVNRKYLPPT